MGSGTFLDWLISLIGGAGEKTFIPSGFLITVLAIGVVGYLIMGWLRN